MKPGVAWSLRSIRVLIAGIFAGVLGIQPAHANGGLTMNGWKTYCFGRFLIDLPQDAEIHGQVYEFIYGRIDTEPLPGGQMAFAQRMKDREEALRAGRHEEKFELIEVRQGQNPTQRIFTLSKMLITFRGYGFEAYRTHGLKLFSLKQAPFNQSKIGEVVREVETQLLPKIRARRVDEIPAEPGFCIKEGFIADDGATPQLEYAEISFGFKHWPDMYVKVHTHTNRDKLQEPLLKRLKAPLPLALLEAAMQIRTLREGKRSVRSLQGEESLATYPTGNGYHYHHFNWESLGEVGSNFAPYIQVELKTGIGQSINETFMRPALTDEEAIRLFDAVVNSIRLQPTGSGGAGR